MKLSSLTTAAAVAICIPMASADSGQEPTKTASCTGKASMPLTCGPVGQETIAYVEFQNTDAEKEGGTYQATVEFDFGATKKSFVDDYPFGKTITRNYTYVYEEPGIYEVSSLLTFGDDAGFCGISPPLKSFTALLNISDASCEYDTGLIVSPTLVPTLPPSLPPSSATFAMHGQYYFAAAATVMFMFLA